MSPCAHGTPVVTCQQGDEGRYGDPGETQRKCDESEAEPVPADATSGSHALHQPRDSRPTANFCRIELPIGFIDGEKGKSGCLIGLTKKR